MELGAESGRLYTQRHCEIAVILILAFELKSKLFFCVNAVNVGVGVCQRSWHHGSSGAEEILVSGVGVDLLH